MSSLKSFGRLRVFGQVAAISDSGCSDVSSVPELSASWWFSQAVVGLGSALSIAHTASLSAVELLSTLDDTCDSFSASLDETLVSASPRNGFMMMQVILSQPVPSHKVLGARHSRNNWKYKNTPS